MVVLVIVVMAGDGSGDSMTIIGKYYICIVGSGDRGYI